jgi:hypothetical protein
MIIQFLLIEYIEYFFDDFFFFDDLLSFSIRHDCSILKDNKSSKKKKSSKKYSMYSMSKNCIIIKKDLIKNGILEKKNK